jgi:protein kinase-like protein
MPVDHCCLTEETLLALAAGEFDERRACALLAQAEQCTDCTLLLCEAGRAVAESAGDGPEPSPWRSTSAALQPGRLLAARFRIVTLLGRGGMGEVYEALDTELGESVALKTIRADLAAAPSNVDRFRQEARLARRVMHPNVCRVLEFGRDDSDPALPVYFLTMELLRGELLTKRLSRQVRLNALESIDIALQIGAGLRAIHAEGVLHRDIKTNNVLVCPGAEQASAADDTSRVVLLDFGIARPFIAGDPSCTHGLPLGTPDYMAPEQLQGQPLSPATDVYAAGVVLFELLTGELPYAGDPTLTRALKRLQSPPPRPSALLADIPLELDSLVTRCLEPDPLHRIASAEEMCGGLSRLRAQLAKPQGAEPSLAGRSTAQGPRPSRRLVWPLIAAAVLAALGVAATRLMVERWPNIDPSVEALAGAPSARPTVWGPGPAHAPAPSATFGSVAAPSTPGTIGGGEAPALPERRPVPRRRVPPTNASAAPLGQAAGSATDGDRASSPPHHVDAEGFGAHRK